MMKKTPKRAQRKSQTKTDLPRPLYSHIQELRGRVLWSLLFLILGTIVGYLLRDQILNWLIGPLNGSLFYTSPVGGLNFILQVSVIFGFLVSIPVVLYNILKFIEPAVPFRSKTIIVKFFFASIILMLIGICFAYYISLPIALKFLGGFSNDKIKPLISTNEYLSFVGHYLVGFGILFQLPLILFAINRFYRVSAKGLLKMQKYVIVASFVVAAIITPTPDFLNQLIMALPLLGLYYGSIVLIFLTNKSKLFV